MVAFFIVWFDTGNIYPVYGLCLMGSIAVAFSKRIARDLRCIAFLSLLTLGTIYLGTGGGVKNSGYMGIWIGLPLFFYVVNHLNLILQDFRFYKIRPKLKLRQQSIYLFLWSVIIAFVSLKGYNISQESYFDLGSRFDKTYTIHSTLARGVYTTKRRASIINPLLAQLDKMLEPNDYLFTYNKIPMVHFLTETKPYMYNPWVQIYDYNSFEKKLNKAEKEIEELPVVVQQKFETIYQFSDPIDDYMSTNKVNSDFHSNENNAIMNSFLKRHNYRVVWSNDYFNIYVSKN